MLPKRFSSFFFLFWFAKVNEEKSEKWPLRRSIDFELYRMFVEWSSICGAASIARTVRRRVFRVFDISAEMQALSVRVARADQSATCSAFALANQLTVSVHSSVRTTRVCVCVQRTHPAYIRLTSCRRGVLIIATSIWLQVRTNNARLDRSTPAHGLHRAQDRDQSLDTSCPL